MALQKQVIPIQLGDGLDKKTDPKQVVPGKMLILENTSLQVTGRYSKRHGFEQRATFGAMATGFVTRKNDLLAFGSSAIKKYNADEGTFVNQSNSQTLLSYDPCHISSSTSVTGGGANINFYDSCIANNVRLVAWVDIINNLKFQLFNVDTGSSITGINRVTGIDCLKTITIGKWLTIFYKSGTSILMIALDSTSPTASATVPITITTTVNATSPVFDACIVNGKCYFAFFTTAGGINVQVINPDLSLGISRILPASDATFGIGIAGDTVLNEIWLAYVPTGTSTAKYTILDQTLVTVLAATSFAATSSSLRVENPCIYTSNGAGKIFYDISQEYTPGDSNVGFLYTNHSYKQAATRLGVLSSVFDLKASVSILSKPFQYTLNGTSVLCILLGYNGHSQGFAFVVNEFGYILAKVGLNGIASGYLYDSYNHLVNASATSFGSVPQVYSLSDTMITIPILEQTAVGSDPNIDGGFSYSYGVNIITLDFNNKDNLQFVETSTQAHITGGFLGNYDGDVFVENGFMIIPEPPQRITAFSGGGTNYFKAGTYQWVLVYEWFDAQNNFHQSAVSEVTEATFASDEDFVSILLNPNYLSFSPKSDNTYLSVYGTEKDGEVFYRLTAVPSNLNASITDNYNVGAGRSGFPTLYTTGGIVDNDPMPAASAIFKYRNRVFIVTPETPNTLWYSKSEIQGIPGTPIAFSSLFTYQVNTSNGNVITGVQIDDKCVLFKPTSMFYFVGDGPNDTGSSNDFSPSNQIPSPVGTSEPRSVVAFQNGAIFKSAQGWFLIDRSLNTSYIGADVESFNSATVINATLLDGTTEIRIVLDTGTALVYDWFVQKWQVAKNYSAICAYNYRNVYTKMLSTGELLSETAAYSDNGQYIPMKFQTSWLSFAGLQGFQRVFKLLLLGDYYSAHAMRITIQYDFNPNTIQTVEINPSNVLNFTETYGSGSPFGTESPDNVFGGVSFADYQLYQWRIFTTIQKCEAIQVTIEDLQTTEIGQSFSLSGLAFEVGVEGGLMRVPASRSFG